MNDKEDIQIIKVGISELGLISSLFNDYRVFYKQASNIKEAELFLQERIRSNDSVIFLALIVKNDEKTPAGFIQLYPSYSSVSLKRLWILNDLYVSKSFRKRGVAKRLLEEAKNFALRTNSKGLVLETAIDNHPAQQLYESFGYQKDKQGYHYNLYV